MPWEEEWEKEYPELKGLPGAPIVASTEFAEAPDYDVAAEAWKETVRKDPSGIGVMPSPLDSDFTKSRMGKLGDVIPTMPVLTADPPDWVKELKPPAFEPESFDDWYFKGEAGAAKKKGIADYGTKTVTRRGGTPWAYDEETVKGLRGYVVSPEAAAEYEKGLREYHAKEMEKGAAKAASALASWEELARTHTPKSASTTTAPVKEKKAEKMITYKGKEYTPAEIAHWKAYPTEGAYNARKGVKVGDPHWYGTPAGAAARALSKERGVDIHTRNFHDVMATWRILPGGNYGLPTDEHLSGFAAEGIDLSAGEKAKATAWDAARAPVPTLDERLDVPDVRTYTGDPEERIAEALSSVTLTPDRDALTDKISTATVETARILEDMGLVPTGEGVRDELGTVIKDAKDGVPSPGLGYGGDTGFESGEAFRDVLEHALGAATVGEPLMDAREYYLGLTEGEPVDPMDLDTHAAIAGLSPTEAARAVTGESVRRIVDPSAPYASARSPEVLETKFEDAFGSSTLDSERLPISFTRGMSAEDERAAYLSSYDPYPGIIDPTFEPTATTHYDDILKHFETETVPGHLPMDITDTPPYAESMGETYKYDPVMPPSSAYSRPDMELDAATRAMIDADMASGMFPEVASSVGMVEGPGGVWEYVAPKGITEAGFRPSGLAKFGLGAGSLGAGLMTYSEPLGVGSDIPGRIPAAHHGPEWPVTTEIPIDATGAPIEVDDFSSMSIPMGRPSYMEKDASGVWHDTRRFGEMPPGYDWKTGTFSGGEPGIGGSSASMTEEERLVEALERMASIPAGFVGGPERTITHIDATGGPTPRFGGVGDITTPGGFYSPIIALAPIGGLGSDPFGSPITSPASSPLPAYVDPFPGMFDPTWSA